MEMFNQIEFVGEEMDNNYLFVSLLNRIRQNYHGKHLFRNMFFVYNLGQYDLLLEC